jgi:hypothetical protein
MCIGEKMKLSVLVVMGLAAYSSIASAAPLCAAGGTMASYVALGIGGCEIGNTLFSNFFYGSTGHGTGVAVAPTAVFLTPVGAGTFNPGPGIIFSSAGWIVPAGSPTTNSFVDSSIGFDVTLIGGLTTMEDATLTMSSFTTTGAGLADITETITPSGIQLQVDSQNGPLVSHGFFPNTNKVSVLKDLLVTVQQGTTGTAQVFSFEENFSQVPEPVGSALVGSGLLALGFWRRRASRLS